MFLSKRSNGIYYLWHYDDLGNVHKVSTGSSSKSDALRFLRTFKQSDHLKKTQLERRSFSAFYEDYLDYSRSVHTPKTRRSAGIALREFQRFVGELPLHKIGFREVERFIAWKRGNVSDSTVRMYYVTLSSAFETARRWNCISDNPFRSVPKPKIPELQPAYFSPDDFLALLGVIKAEDYRELVLCGVSTGLRLGELLSLQWKDVDFAQRVVRVQNSDVFTTKNKRNRCVPMTSRLYAMLEVRKTRATCGLVFHNNFRRMTEDNVSKTFKRHVRAAGLGHELHFHSLRHTFATWLAQAGVSIFEIQKLLGHSSISTTMVYAHLAPSELHGAVNKIQLPEDRGTSEDISPSK